ncbi:hypothetical protein MBLNU13_g06736t1 [Cladosporium sp. NU13]
MTVQFITDAVLAPSRARSPPDDGAGGDRKRRRKVLSCYDCRRRKLQCDRAMPACGRCVKAGQESSCVYSEDATDPQFRSSKPQGPEQSGPSTADPATTSSYTDAPPSDLSAKMSYQERRIQQLEAALARTTSNRPEASAARQFEVLKLPFTPESIHDSGLGSNINDRETMLLRGRGFETQFSGTTHPLSLIAHVPELNLFTKEALERYPSFQRARQDMGALEARTKCADKHRVDISDDELHTLLPPHSETNRAVDLYLESYDRIYHVIHGPSFWEAYRNMWQGNLRDASRHTVVTVLLMVACVSCVGPAHPWTYIANSSKAREGAIVITQACESWINRQSQKRVSAADFQIRFLLCLTKQTTARKYKRTWTEAGTLLRFCMSAGLHRNPDLIRRPTTPLEKELRRRIWAAVLDFELQASFDRGMISAPWLLQSDSPAPHNLHDEEIAMAHPPSPRPAKEFTSAWYLSTSNDTVMLRSTLNTVLNNIRHVLDFEQVKQYTDEIETHLSSLPDLPAQEAEEAHSLYRLKLLQYQLALHNRFLRSTSTSSERMFSTMTILETASKIINIHQRLTAYDKRALQFLGYDLLRASLSMANVVSVQALKPRSLLTPIVFQHTPLMHEVIHMLTDKAARLGCEQRQMWVALAALGYVKSRQNPEKRNEYMKEAVDVITKAYDEMMSYQDGVSPEASLRRDVQESRGSRGIVDYLPAVPGQPDEPDSEPDLNNTALFNFDDFAAWTFEDWMFDPNDPSLTINGS